MADEHHHTDPTFYRTPRDAAEAAAGRGRVERLLLVPLGALTPGPGTPARDPYQRAQCTTSSNGRRSGRWIGASGRSAG